jgi:hypothetical protein
MDSLKERLDREVEGLPISSEALAKTIARARRRSRNQRIAAGVVGIAVFVAAVWVVTGGGWFDRTETPAVPGPAVTGPTETGTAETGPTETGPTALEPAETGAPPAPASAAPDEVKQRTCSDGAGSRLELTDIGDRIKVRFEVRRSLPGHLWHIWMVSKRALDPVHRRRIFGGARVASDSGDFEVVGSRPAITGGWLGVRVKAIDSATGQVCEVSAFVPPS